MRTPNNLFLHPSLYVIRNHFIISIINLFDATISSSESIMSTRNIVIVHTSHPHYKSHSKPQVCSFIHSLLRKKMKCPHNSQYNHISDSLHHHIYLDHSSARLISFSRLFPTFHASLNSLACMVLYMSNMISHPLWLPHISRNFIASVFSSKYVF